MIGFLLAWNLRCAALGLIVGSTLWLTGARNPYLQKSAWTAVLIIALLMPLAMSTLSMARVPGWVVYAPGYASALRNTSTSEPLVRSTLLSLEAVYFLGAILLLTRYALNLLRKNLIRADAKPLRAGWTAGLDVRLTGKLRSPATFGTTVLLPDDGATWSADNRTAVIAHERAHVMARDCHRLWLARAYGCLCWPNPFAWWLERRLAELAEETSDCAAAQALGDRAAYARILLEFASRAARDRRELSEEATAAMIRSNLAARIERLVALGAPAAAPRRGRALLAVWSVVGISVVLGAIQLRAAPLARARAALAAELPGGAFALRGLYPRGALAARQGGLAYLRVTVDAGGHLTNVHLIREAPRGAGFARAAVAAAYRLKYTNATGRTVVSVLPVKFMLTPTRAPTAARR